MSGWVGGPLVSLLVPRMWLNYSALFIEESRQLLTWQTWSKEDIPAGNKADIHAFFL